MKRLFAFLIITIFPALSFGQAIIADHNSAAEFDEIPESYFSQIASNFRFYYAHTSHGSQIMTGLGMLEAENALYDQPYFHEVADDLGHAGDISWVQPTRDYLDANPDINMATWSWCAGVSDNDEAGIDAYLNAVNQLESEYPSVTFIYMTGHLWNEVEGTKETTTLMNQRIRDYVNNNAKILFDFEDIESYDPNGNYYPNDYDRCEWCVDWCSVHDCPSCYSCAHSHCFNCYLKGKAFWWLMARLAGWNVPSSGDDDDDDGDGESSSGASGSCGRATIESGSNLTFALIILLSFGLIVRKRKC